MKVERDRCTATLRGLADLPVHESFSLWGKLAPPAGAGLEAQLASRTSRGGTTDEASGIVYFGTSVE